MARFDLSDAEWSLIKPLLPRHVTRGFGRGLFFMVLAAVIDGRHQPLYLSKCLNNV
jgi:transposase